jgi:hypothetical protein
VCGSEIGGEGRWFIAGIEQDTTLARIKRKFAVTAAYITTQD